MHTGQAQASSRGREKDLQFLNRIVRITAQELEPSAMLQEVSKALQEEFGWEVVAFLSIGPEKKRYTWEAISSRVPTTIRTQQSWAILGTVVQRVMNSGETVFLEPKDYAGSIIQSVAGGTGMYLPVAHRGQVMGVMAIEVASATTLKKQKLFLETVAEQVGFAFANVRLSDELRRRAKLLEMVAEISRKALQTSELTELMQQVADYVRREFDLKLTSIMMLDAEMGEYELAVFAGSAPSRYVKGMRWSTMQGIVGRAIRTSSIQVVPDVRKDPDYVTSGPQITSEMAIPLVFQGKLMGVLDMLSGAVETFARENQLALEAIADQIAGAIHLASVNSKLGAANQELQDAIARLQGLSTSDGLTGIPNRRQFEEVLWREWRRGIRQRDPMAVIMIDIDHFKAFNDCYGHQGGDECLKAVAQELKRSLSRASDFIARYGGEEFVAILAGSDGSQAAQTAERLRQRIEALDIPHEKNEAGKVTVSLGVAAIFPKESTTPTELLDSADSALYESKNSGRNRVTVFQPTPA
jgi:diguanylate cyclase (GGDEF)-like protein